MPPYRTITSNEEPEITIKLIGLKDSLTVELTRLVKV